MVMNLATPPKIRTLQRKLYCKAKAEPDYRFYLLYDKICREDIHAYVSAGSPPRSASFWFRAIMTHGRKSATASTPCCGAGQGILAMGHA